MGGFTTQRETPRAVIKDILVEFSDIFTRHRLDISYLLPKSALHVNLKDDLTVDTALMRTTGLSQRSPSTNTRFHFLCIGNRMETTAACGFE